MISLNFLAFPSFLQTNAIHLRQLRPGSDQILFAVNLLQSLLKSIIFYSSESAIAPGLVRKGHGGRVDQSCPADPRAGRKWRGVIRGNNGLANVVGNEEWPSAGNPLELFSVLPAFLQLQLPLRGRSLPFFCYLEKQKSLQLLPMPDLIDFH